MMRLLRRFALALAGVVFVVFFWFLHPLDTLAATLTVTTTNDTITAGNGLSLREAISCINAGSNAPAADCPAMPSPAYGTSDTINFNIPGTGPKTILVNGSALPTLTRSMTIDGSTEPVYPVNNIVVDGNSLGSVFSVSSEGLVTLNGLTIQHGSGTDCLVFPGAICGGAILNNGGTTVTNSTLSGNSAILGGGIYNNGTLTVTNSTLSGNTVLTTDGSYGGGIENYSGTLTVTNSTLSGNSAIDSGGGIDNYGGTLTVTNSTLSGNSAGIGGGGISPGTARVTLTNTIVANSRGGDLATSGPGSFTGTNNLIGDGSGGIVGSNGNISGNPLLAPLGNYGGPTQTFALLPGSPALDAGASVGSTSGTTTVPNTDQRGKSRPVDTPGVTNATDGTDIGAVEMQGFTLTINGGNNQKTAISTAFAQPLVVLLTETGGGPFSGVPITFTPSTASTGATATLSTLTATTNASGVASVTATANNKVGAYFVSASVQGADAPASFSLANSGACVVNSTMEVGDTGKTTLNDAVMVANLGACSNNNTITFDSTVFPPATPTTITIAASPYELTYTGGSTTIDGTGHMVVIDGSSFTTIFFVEKNVTATFNFLTMQHGFSSDGGGAIDNGGTLTLNTCTLTDNSGGGASGGAIETFGMLTVTNSTFARNSARIGGAINADDGSVQITGSTFTGNIVPGAAPTRVPSKASKPRLSRPVRTDEFTNAGGALFICSCTTVAVTNSTFSGNSAGNIGGAILDEGPLTLMNVTISGNNALTGGGIDVDAPSGGTLTATNTLIAGNTGTTGPDVNGAFQAGSANNLIGNGTGMTGLTNGTNGNQVGTGGSPINPKLGALGSYGGPTQTLSLLPGSTALDAGTTSGAPATDQRAITRPQGGGIDIGAFEARFTLIIKGGSNQSTPVTQPFTQPLALTFAGDDAPATLSGISVTFTPPASGASATLGTPNPATTNESGQASVTATANATVGGPYTVSASTPGVMAVTFALTNTPPTITLSPTTLPAGVKNIAYLSTTISATGGTAPYTFSVPPGTLPPGLTLASDGTLSGTPTTTGPFTFTVTATDQHSFTGTQQYTVTISAAPLARIVVTYKGSTTPTMKVGEVGPFIATAVYSDNTMADITSQVVWSGNAAVTATVDATGKVTTMSPGTVTITARQGEISGQAVTTVTPGTPSGVAPAPAPANRPAGTTGQPSGPPGGTTPNPAPPSR